MLKKIELSELSIQIPHKQLQTKATSRGNTSFLFQTQAVKALKSTMNHPKIYPHFIVTAGDGLDYIEDLLKEVKNDFEKSFSPEKFYFDPESRKISPEETLGSVPLFDRDARKRPFLLDQNPNISSVFGIPGEHTYSAGDIVMANGGFLILPMSRLDKDPALMDLLLSVLSSGEIDFRKLPELLYFRDMDRSIRIPVFARIILFGSEFSLDHLLRKHGLFGKIFKTKIDLEDEAELTPGNISNFSKYIDSLKEEGLPDLDPSAKEVLLRDLLIQNESRTSFSLSFAESKAIYEEAIVLFPGKKSLGANEVEKAIASLDSRYSLPKKKYYEELERGVFNLKFTGSRLGRINALSIYSPFGNYQEYGQVNVISARVLMGSGNFINIEREVNLSGDVHDKGVYVLQSFLKGILSNYSTLGVDISILFEQSHMMVDGDSATVAELLITLSALSGIEIPCNLAVTGSMSQYGEVMPVGAVSRKITAWYEISSLLGNSRDTYHVFLPETNSKELILDKNVQSAIAKKKFTVNSYSHVEDIIPRVLGLPLGKIEKNGKFSENSVMSLIEKRLEPKKEA